MSVPKDRRKTGVLSVNIKARELAVYTLKITANPKNFSQDQKPFIDILNKTAIKIHTLCWEANNIRADVKTSLKRRIKLEGRAADRCNTLCALIEIAYPLFHLSTKRVVFWMDLTTATRNQILAWRKSDKERLKKMLSESVIKMEETAIKIVA